MAESFAELFEASVQGLNFKTGDLRQAEIVEITPDFVVLFASGSKSEAYVPVNEFKNAAGELEVKVGDTVDVVLEAFENGSGRTIFSREEAKRLETWKRIEDAFHNGEAVDGAVVERVRGGFTVEIGKVKAFLPGSLVDLKPVRDSAAIEGKEMKFKIIKVDKAQNNVVVSRRAAMMEENSPEREALLSSLVEGSELTGTVKNLTDYGAFVDLGGVDGLLHITDISWKRIHHPSEVLKVGDVIKVRVLKYDGEKGRVSLGLKQLLDDPWRDVERRYPVGSRVFGKVTNITDYGCFVEIEDGIEGLVHMSELSWTNKNLHPSKVVNQGDEVEVMVLEIDESRRRISLGIKQCKPNPWKEYAAAHVKGEMVKGAIKSITDFGLFIGLDGGIDGLVHVSDLSWSDNGEEELRTNYRKGQEIEAVVLAIDADRERISLGIKQLTNDAYSDWLVEHPQGSVVSGTVTEVSAKVASIDLGGGIVGHVRESEVSRERVKDIAELLSVGDHIEAKVLGMDKKVRAINLSIKELQPELGGNDAPINTQLGDLLKQEMSNKE